MHGDLPELSILKYVVFDWDNTLSDQAELGSEQRTFAFPEETVYVFKQLHDLGVVIKITSNQTPKEAIINCLNANKLKKCVNDENIICGEKAINRIQILQNINENIYIFIQPSEICLVDDSQTNCQNAQQQNFETVQVSEIKDDHITSPIHLHQLLIKLNINDSVTQAADIAIQKIKDLESINSVNGFNGRKKLTERKEAIKKIYQKFRNDSFSQFINQSDNKLLAQEVDISKHPALTNDLYVVEADQELTIGDMHGNALKFLYFLVRHGVLKLPEADYNDLYNIYKKTFDKLTIEDINRFNEIITKAVINPHSPKIRLIGDELADRGKNDYFTLKLLEKLNKNNVPVEILLSNHSIEFIENYEKNGDFSPTLLRDEHAVSLLNLQYLVQEGLVSETEINKITEEAYLPNVKALSYSLSDDNSSISVFSHAPIGISAIIAIAKKLNIECQVDTALNIAETIEQINHVLELYKKTKKIHTLYSPEIMFMGYSNKFIDVAKYPFEYLMWNRAPVDEDDRPDFVTFIHGHHPVKSHQENVVNLDNNLGKGEDVKGEYTVFVSGAIQLSPEKRKIIKEELDFLNDKIELQEDKLKSTILFKKLSQQYLSGFSGLDKIELEVKLEKAFQTDDSIKYALGMLYNHKMINIENINFICDITDITINAHKKAIYIRDTIASLQNALTTEIKKTYGDKFQNSGLKHSRALSAKRLSNINAKSLPELKKILRAERLGANYSPSFSFLYDKVVKPKSRKSSLESYFNHKTWYSQSSVLDALVVRALKYDLKKIDLDSQNDEQLEFEKILQHGAHLLLDYVDSRERSLRYKFLYQSDPQSPLSLRIKNAGELAHILLKCRNQNDLTLLNIKAKAIIEDEKNKDSTLKILLSGIVKNIDHLKSTLVFDGTALSGLSNNL